MQRMPLLVRRVYPAMCDRAINGMSAYKAGYCTHMTK